MKKNTTKRVYTHAVVNEKTNETVKYFYGEWNAKKYCWYHNSNAPKAMYHVIKVADLNNELAKNATTKPSKKASTKKSETKVQPKAEAKKSNTKKAQPKAEKSMREKIYDMAHRAKTKAQKKEAASYIERNIKDLAIKAELLNIVIMA